MGRKPSVNNNLPKGLRARKQRSGKVYYYYDTGKKPRHEIPLGDDYPMAVKKWAELEIDAAPRHVEIITFRYAAERYVKEALPGKAARTRKDNLAELGHLYQFFDNPPAPLDRIEPIHIRQYMDWRGKTAKVRANREKALFSAIWNFSRERGLTARENPCRGVKGFKETGRRDIYIDDQVFRAVYAYANPSVRDAMDLAYLTGQRPADVVKMSETDIRDNELAITQNKTGARLRISLLNEDGTQNELGKLIERINERKRQFKIRTLKLLVNSYGQSLTYSALDNAFEKARAAAAEHADGVLKPLIKAFQFRDLRAKAGTDKADSAGILDARRQLGHGSVTMTEHYVRLGDRVKPTK